MSICLSDFLNSGALISLPHEKLLVGWGEVQPIVNQQVDMNKPAFYFSDFFFAESSPWIQYLHWTEVSYQDFESQLELISPLSTCDWIIDKPEQFRQAFFELWQQLQTDQLQKAVPYLFARSSSQMSKQRLQHCLKTGLTSLKNKAGYLYGHWNLSQGLLGITPEILFSHSQHQPQKIHTMALAGTCRSSYGPEIFMQNDKERYEHQLVVQGICQSLQSLGSVKMGDIQLLKLPGLTHLLTPIEAELRQPFHFDTLAHRLHPTPALGAVPLKEGKKWLEQFQKHTPRDYYGAPIGFKYPQKGLSHCLVGIRNVQWDTSGLRIGAGCGVVKQSTFEKEWQEIQFKIRAIRDQLYL